MGAKYSGVPKNDVYFQSLFSNQIGDGSFHSMNAERFLLQIENIRTSSAQLESAQRGSALTFNFDSE